MNHISGIVVRVLASSVINRVFEPRLGQTHDYKIGILSFSARHAALRSNTGWLEIEIMCPSGATCLPVTVVSVS